MTVVTGGEVWMMTVALPDGSVEVVTPPPEEVGAAEVGEPELPPFWLGAADVDAESGVLVLGSVVVGGGVVVEEGEVVVEDGEDVVVEVEAGEVVVGVAVGVTEGAAEDEEASDEDEDEGGGVVEETGEEDKAIGSVEIVDVSVVEVGEPDMDVVVKKTELTDGVVIDAAVVVDCRAGETDTEDMAWAKQKRGGPIRR
jgi:hypothetical protein